METQADTLFKQKSTIELRDYNLQISLDTVKLKDTFNTKLSETYREILNINGFITHLFDETKKLDSELMNLCFDDGKYKLKKVDDSYSNELNINVIHSNNKRTKSLTHTQNPLYIEGLLKLSSFSTSLSKFKMSHNGFNFKSLMEEFNHISHFKGDINMTIISKQCSDFESWVLDIQPSLAIDQYIQLYHEISNFKKFQFSSKIPQWIFAELLNNYKDFLNYESPSVQNFIHNPDFKVKLIEVLNNECEILFKKLNKDELSDKVFDVLKVSDNISDFITNVDMYCQGIYDEKKVNLKECTTEIIRIRSLLIKFGCKNQVINLTNRLTKILKNELDIILDKSLPDSIEIIHEQDNITNSLERVIKSNLNSDTPTSQSINRLIKQHNLDRFQNFIETTISELSLNSS